MSIYQILFRSHPHRFCHPPGCPCPPSLNHLPPSGCLLCHPMASHHHQVFSLWQVSINAPLIHQFELHHIAKFYNLHLQNSKARRTVFLSQTFGFVWDALFFHFPFFSLVTIYIPFLWPVVYIDLWRYFCMSFPNFWELTNISLI